MKRTLSLYLAMVIALAACSAERGSEEPLSGQALAADLGCLACHTDVDSSVAPTWNGIWGTEVELEDGRTVTVDEEYVRRSIEDPRADIVSGYIASMPVIPMSAEEKAALVDYIRSLG
ncbi:MAG: c-type cytochrome [Acidimicrobiia bacterium]